MTAEEMFKEMGYKIESDGPSEKLYKKYKPSTEIYRFIRFMKYAKEIEVGGVTNEIKFDEDREFMSKKLIYTPKRITLSQLKAINQQCKELGWLDE